MVSSCFTKNAESNTQLVATEDRINCAWTGFFICRVWLWEIFQMRFWIRDIYIFSACFPMFHHCQWSTGWSFKARCGAHAAGYTQPGSRVVSLEKSSQHRNNQPAQRDPALLRFSPETLTIDLAKVVSARLYMYILYAVYKYIDTFISYYIILYVWLCRDHEHIWNKYIQRLHFCRQKHHSPRPPPQKAPALLGSSMVRSLVDSLTKHGGEMLGIRTYLLVGLSFGWWRTSFTIFYFSNVIWCPTHQVYFNLGFKTVQAKDL